MADGGYDVADYRDIDPLFGTLADADALIGEAHELGLRVLLDIVPNHTSDRHPWFVDALAAGPGSPERLRYLFREGRGRGGSEPPTDWESVFGGPAWTRVVEPDGQPGQWYLHLFAPEQPDLDWSHPEVRAEFEAILRFWYERGADGFRIDVAHGLVKDPAFPDLGPRLRAPRAGDPRPHPHWDQDGVHDIYRRWRAVADAYGERPFVAEVFVSHPERLARFVRPDELHTAFDFRFLKAGWEPNRLREAIDDGLRALEPVGAPATWVLSNHDQIRHVTRLGRAAATAPEAVLPLGPAGTTLPVTGPSDLALGRRRARAAVLLMLALPGLCLPLPGRGARPRGGPRPARRAPPGPGLAALRTHDPGSRRLPRAAALDRRRLPVRVRAVGLRAVAAPTGGLGRAQRRGADRRPRIHAGAVPVRPPAATRAPGFRSDGMTWLDAPEGVLRFRRGDGLEVVVNVTADSVPLDLGARRVLLASVPLDDEGDVLPGDAAAWLG